MKRWILLGAALLLLAGCNGDVQPDTPPEPVQTPAPVETEDPGEAPFITSSADDLDAATYAVMESALMEGLGALGLAGPPDAVHFSSSISVASVHDLYFLKVNIADRQLDVTVSGTEEGDGACHYAVFSIADGEKTYYVHAEELRSNYNMYDFATDELISAATRVPGSVKPEAPAEGSVEEWVQLSLGYDATYTSGEGWVHATAMRRGAQAAEIFGELLDELSGALGYADQLADALGHSVLQVSYIDPDRKNIMRFALEWHGENYFASDIEIGEDYLDLFEQYGAMQ